MKKNKKQVMKKEREKQLKINLLVLLLSVIVSFLIFEVVFRMIDFADLSIYENAKWLDNDGMYKLSKNDKLVWEFDPNKGDINSYGMRDYEYKLIKPDNTFRIAVLGDSITMGAFVKKEDTYENVLERTLNENNDKKKYSKIEVLNFGVTGYNVFQYEETLKTKVLKFNPDVIIIGFSANDFIYTPISLKKDNETLLIINYFQDDLLLNNKVSWFMFRNSKFFRFVYKRLSETLIFKDWNPETPIYLHLLMYRDSGFKSLTNIKEIANQNNIKLILAIFPYFIDKNYNMAPQSSVVYDEVEEFCKKNSILYISFFEVFKWYNLSEIYSIPYDGVHPNKKGNEIVGKELYKLISAVT